MADDTTNPKDLGTGERMAVLSAAKTDAMKHTARGEHETDEGSLQRVDTADVTAITANWPKAQQMVLKTLLEAYGPPNEATPTKLFWYNNGPWKRTVLTSDIVVHNFPTPHSDFLTQYIDYQVPVDMFDEIGQYDGSCLVDRTAGEAAARCDSEAMNILTMNLMHDIVTGAKSVEEARSTYAENAAAFTLGRSAPYAEAFQFELPAGNTEDPDEGMIAGSMARQTLGKVKDLLTGGDRDAPADG